MNFFYFLILLLFDIERVIENKKRVMASAFVCILRSIIIVIFFGTLTPGYKVLFILIIIFIILTK